MAEPTVICPNCKTEIKLNESLAGPLLEATRRDFEKRLKQKDTDLAAKLKEESTKIATEEARKAKLALSNELDQKTRAVAELEKTLTENNTKLAEAQKAQADLLRKQRELDTKLREADLSVEKRVQEGLNATREQARKEVEGELKLKVAEKEQTIISMQKQIEELKRRAEQGSQQLQQRFNCSGWSVSDLYILGRKDKLLEFIDDIAFGSVLHTVQDSFAEGHVERERSEPGAMCSATAPFPRPGNVREFHGYASQDGHLHDAKDIREAMSGPVGGTVSDAVRASRQLARFYRNGATWAQVEPYMQCLFTVNSESRRSSAGDQFRRR